MDQDAADLYERLRITLDRADGGRVKIADEIEYVLTEGYAYALNLELRPQRIEKRIIHLVTTGETSRAASVTDGTGCTTVCSIGVVASRMASADATSRTMVSIGFISGEGKFTTSGAGSGRSIG